MKQIRKVVSVVLIIAVLATVVSCGEPAPPLSNTEAFGIATIGVMTALLSVELVGYAAENGLPEVEGVSIDLDKDGLGIISWKNFNLEETIVSFADSLDDLEEIPDDVPDYESIKDSQGGNLIIRDGSSITIAEETIDIKIILQVVGFGAERPADIFTIEIFISAIAGEEAGTASVNGVEIDFANLPDLDEFFDELFGFDSDS